MAARCTEGEQSDPVGGMAPAARFRSSEPGPPIAAPVSPAWCHAHTWSSGGEGEHGEQQEHEEEEEEERASERASVSANAVRGTGGVAGAKKER